MNRKIVISYWIAGSLVALAFLIPWMIVYALTAPLRLWEVVAETTRERLAEIEMRGVVVRAIAKAARDAHAELEQQRGELVN